METVEGIGEVLRALDGVPRRLQTKVLRRGLRRGAALVRDHARQRVRRRSGLLAKSIVVASSRGSGQRGAVAYKVGLRSRAWYGRLLEFGHVKRGRGQKIAGGERRRTATREVLKGAGQFVPPYPFMRPAAEKLPEALTVVGDTVRGALESGELTR
ncbi:HK97 gp10 family phage protein [Chromobacterium violaceum]|uniref:HK97-gp10 family putative phage morphogenesis protein n=1 Tax=Chromobacterium violaceum TaxID=536 RepID=UPI001B32B9F8|nr:HK97-gp10 family putative phage morphogenesis protein [Chromobacterium violaceum]MBP4051997.1 HK97 gp10 family phage protein [Chromobacterium violaceum]